MHVKMHGSDLHAWKLGNYNTAVDKRKQLLESARIAQGGVHAPKNA